MPNTINIYEPRNMMAVVERREKPTTFLRDTFFTRREMSTTDKVDIDIVKGNRNVAPFVHKVKGGKVIPNTGYQTNTYEPPLVAPKKVTTVDDLLHRQPGENLYSQQTPAQRAVAKMKADFEDLDDMDTRREEVMCAQAIFNGEIEVVGDGINERITFDFENKETLLAKKWSDPAADPIADLARWKRKVQKTGFVNPNICIMGSTAVAAFLANKKVQEILDIKNMSIATIAPAELPSGASYIGHIALHNISIYTYNQYFTDDWTDKKNPAQKPFVPDNAVALLSTDAKWVMAYAAITIMDQATGATVTYEAERVPDTYIEKDPDRRFFSLKCKPLPIPTEANSWFVGYVCDSNAEE